MGGTSSTTSANLTSNTIITNENSMNYLNSLVNKAAVDTMIENVKKCSASLVQNQKLTIKGLKCGDNCNIALLQDQKSWLDFTCAQKDDIQMSVIQKMIDTMQQALKDNVSADILNKMNSNLSTKSKQDWGTFPWSGSTANTNVNQAVNNFVTNKTNTNVKNAIENSMYASFKNSNINNCIAQIIATQEITAQDIQAGAQFTFTINQTQTANLVAQCIQNANITNQVVADVAKFAGLDLQIQKSNSSSTTSEATAETSAKNTGLLQGIGDAAAGVGAAVGNIFSAVGLAFLTPFMGPSSASSISCCLCLCCLMIIMLMAGGMGDGGDVDYQ